MSKIFKFALVATLLMVGGCASFEGAEGGGKEPAPKELEYEVVAL